MNKSFFTLLLLFAAVLGFNSCSSDTTELEDQITELQKQLAENVNGHEYIDLGLPSGNLWATCNIGTNSQTDNGIKIKWGATTTDTNIPVPFLESGIQETAKFSKYNEKDKKAELELDDDIAHIQLGGAWRIPTLYDIEELLAQCVWSKNESPAGYIGKSKNNENSIFIAGENRNIYCSRSVNTDKPYYIYGILLSDGVFPIQHFREEEFYLRPVCYRSK